jgi:hypothetical protein
MSEAGPREREPDAPPPAPAEGPAAVRRWPGDDDGASCDVATGTCTPAAPDPVERKTDG